MVFGTLTINILPRDMICSNCKRKMVSHGDEWWHIRVTWGGFEGEIEILCPECKQKEEF